MSLKKRYRESIQPKLLKDLNLSNIHEVPKVVKVTINRGLGEAAQNAKALEASITELATITGQKVVVTRAKKAIAGFKIRQGMPIGVAVNLRTRHVKPTQEGESGRIVTEEASVHASNVMLYSSSKQVASRVEIVVEKDGTKKRRLKKTGEILD